LVWVVRERPVTVVVLDTASFDAAVGPGERLVELRRLFPSLATVLVARPELDPLTLLRLGRAGISDLALISLDDLRQGLARGVARAAARSTRSQVLRAIGRRLAFPEHLVVRAALDGALLGWHADDLAASAGWSRAHLSVRLRAVGLPSAGRLLLWARLMHAGRWLGEPGRSAESVSRQLDYANGATFRRALRNYVELTPTEIRSEGGLDVVLRAFLDVCGLNDSLRDARSVA
jgi:AraC-like DNA-binding protein